MNTPNYRLFVGLIISDVIRRSERYFQCKIPTPNLVFKTTRTFYEKSLHKLVIENTENLEELEKIAREYTIYHVLCFKDELSTNSRSKKTKEEIAKLNQELFKTPYPEKNEELMRIRKLYCK